MPFRNTQYIKQHVRFKICLFEKKNSVNKKTRILSNNMDRVNGMNTIIEADKQRNKGLVIIETIDNYIAVRFWHTE